VEDNKDDEELALLAFQMNRIPAELVVARDGAEALEYLHGQEHPRPSLILLDLKLPRVDGLEVLRRLRADERTRTIPIIILSTSMEETDQRRSAELGADQYVRKPVSFSEFRETTQELADTWLGPRPGPGATS
jgi:two-component system response regulator